MTVDVQEAHEPTTLCNALPCELGPQTLTVPKRCEPGELAAERLHLGNTVQPQHATQVCGVPLLECLGTGDPPQCHAQQDQQGGAETVEGWTDRPVHNASQS